MTDVQVVAQMDGAGNAVRGAAKVPFGEELPIFCEKCGYSLNGLPQNRCDGCQILHFHCPECGHHQPINTLRPAAQRILGRLRGLGIALILFLKINFFCWLLFAWFGMGVGWGETRQWTGNGVLVEPAPLTMEMLVAFAMLAIPFGLCGRMLLLRWRQGVGVGLVLATLVCLSILLGFHLLTVMDTYSPRSTRILMNEDRAILLAYTFLLVCGSAVLAWPMWVGLANLFLPARSAKALLDWQRSLSDGSALARQ